MQDNRKKIEAINREMAGKMKELHAMMKQGGLEQATSMIEKCFGSSNPEPMQKGVPQSKHKSKECKSTGTIQNINMNHAQDSFNQLNLSDRLQSIETIYKNAVEKRVSSSSDECVDLSDENLDFLAVNWNSAEHHPDWGNGSQGPQLMPSSSNTPVEMVQPGFRGQVEQRQESELTAEQKAEKIIIEAEAAKARMFPRGPGNDKLVSAQIDDDYLVIGSHIDELTQNKIMKDEYIDFVKLLPRDRIVSEEDGRMELVVKNGKTFWVPVTETVAINGFSKWEQAFRIFSNIFTKFYPHKSGELIQYNHVIHSISAIYTWENVYSYDKKFRMHLVKHHPNQSWAVILQQAWSMHLRYRIYHGDSNQHHHGGVSAPGHSNNGKGGKGEPCRRYNQGKCNFGVRCRYDHRCEYSPCGKFGHSILNCRKLAADRERTANHKGNNNNGGGGNSSRNYNNNNGGGNTSTSGDKNN